VIVTRRGFLGAILALGAAPAIVRASSLMRIATPALIVPDQTIWQMQMHNDAPFLSMEDFIERQVNEIARQIAKGVDADLMATAMGTRLIDTPLQPQWARRYERSAT
jgi:hypothetical protein